MHPHTITEFTVVTTANTSLVQGDTLGQAYHCPHSCLGESTKTFVRPAEHPGSNLLATHVATQCPSGGERPARCNLSGISVNLRGPREHGLAAGTRAASFGRHLSQRAGCRAGVRAIQRSRNGCGNGLCGASCAAHPRERNTDESRTRRSTSQPGGPAFPVLGEPSVAIATAAPVSCAHCPRASS